MRELDYWKSKKQSESAMSRSSVEAEYSNSSYLICHMSLCGLSTYFEELNLNTKLPLTMYCGNQIAFHIASNPIFNEQTKHIEVDCHLV